MAEVLSGAYMFWVGIDATPETTPEQAEALGSFYRDVHMAEFLSKNPGFTRATRYELIDQDPRGNLGPTWLTMYEMGDEAAYQAYRERGALPADQKPTYQPRPEIANGLPTKWRMIWRKVSEAGATSSGPPRGIFMVGMNVPPDTTAEGLAEFNAFYTNTHVGEVMAMGSYDRGVRYELQQEMQHQPPGCPRFCAIYTADEAATQATLARRKVNPGRSPLSSGPPTWEAHDTLWRLVYRLVDSVQA